MCVFDACFAAVSGALIVARCMYLTCTFGTESELNRRPGLT